MYLLNSGADPGCPLPCAIHCATGWLRAAKGNPVGSLNVSLNQMDTAEPVDLVVFSDYV